MPQHDPYAAIAKPDKAADPYAAIATGAQPGEEGFEAASAPYGNAPPQDTIIGGGLRRGRDIVKGAYKTVADPPTAEEQKRGAVTDDAVGEALQRPVLVAGRVGRGVVEGEKEAAKQTKEQLSAAQGIHGDPVQKGLAYARAGVTAASMADPFATGPVTNVNKLSDEGRYKEALGAGTFDALSLLVGGKTGREVSPESRLNKLAYATGAKSVRPLAKILPDIEATVAKVGKPQTVGELQNVVQTTMDGYEQRFNAGLAGTKGSFVPDQIADALESKAKSLPPTREGQEIAKQLRKAAVEYRKPWTAQELNAERMYRNANTQAFHNKGGTGQMAAMRANPDTMIDETVARESRDVLYDEMEQQHPGSGFKDLKQKQSAVLDMLDNFKDHVEKLEATQAKKGGAPLRERVTTSTSVHPGGVTPRLHGLTNLIPGGGPLKAANKATSSAFGPTASATARRAAILSLPVTSLTLPRGATVPPVPARQNDQGPEDQ